MPAGEHRRHGLPFLIHVKQVLRHRSVSAAPGGDRIIVSVEGLQAIVERRWRSAFAARALVFDSAISRGSDGTLTIVASFYPYLPSDLVVDALQEPRVSAKIRRRLDTLAGDARHFWRGTVVHHAIADAHAWPALHTQLGRENVTLLGMGRHATRLVRNLPEHVGSPLVIAGRDKGAGRDLLAAAGVPVIEGVVVDDPGAAVRWASTRGPVVLKSLVGGNGDGVMPKLSDPKDIRSAAARLLGPASPFVLIERFVVGTELRVHVVAGDIAAVRRAVDVAVDADGTAPISALIQSQRPDVWHTTRRVPWLRSRLVGLTWHLGVRRFADLDRTVPPPGSLRVGGSDRSEPLPLDAIAPRDREAVEWLFRRYGPASGGIDLLVSALGLPMSEGGGVLDLNIPCGSAFLGADVPKLAARELEAWLPRSFRIDGGRVPLYLAAGLTNAANLELREAFTAVYPSGVVATLDPDHAWARVFDRREATALLAIASVATIRAVGIPRHTRPVVLTDGDDVALSELASNAGGRVVAWVGGSLPPTLIAG